MNERSRAASSMLRASPRVDEIQQLVGQPFVELPGKHHSRQLETQEHKLVRDRIAILGGPVVDAVERDQKRLDRARRDHRKTVTGVASITRPYGRSPQRSFDRCARDRTLLRTGSAIFDYHTTAIDEDEPQLIIPAQDPHNFVNPATTADAPQQHFIASQTADEVVLSLRGVRRCYLLGDRDERHVVGDLQQRQAVPLAGLDQVSRCFLTDFT